MAADKHSQKITLPHLWWNQFRLDFPGQINLGLIGRSWAVI
jgi:hypothetical protein